MTHNQFDRQLSYQIGLLLINKLKINGDINNVTQKQIIHKLNDNFLPIIGGIK